MLHQIKNDMKINNSQKLIIIFENALANKKWRLM